MRVFLFILLAILLMVFDHRSVSFHRFRTKLAVIAVPIQQLVNTPIKIFHWLGTSVVAQRHLLDENARLRAHELLLQSKLQKLLALERENAQLRELLKSTVEIPGHVVVAQLLAVDLDPSLHQFVVDKGVRDHIYVGQPVLDAYGVLGQVIDVGLLTSKILLVTDTRFAIPVQNYRNGIRAIAVGLGEQGKLALINVPETSDIKDGDLFVTSGLGLHYPVGYPVGVVSNRYDVRGGKFLTVILTPSAHLDQTQQVLMAWPSRAVLYSAVQKELAKTLPTH